MLSGVCWTKNHCNILVGLMGLRGIKSKNPIYAILWPKCWIETYTGMLSGACWTENHCSISIGLSGLRGNKSKNPISAILFYI